ncbi:hypothetical protein C0Q70_07435 [Pomacea canaliculata]|uniref:Uncharacterized protein n=1 Tax=Pomacea canaliculata TaxID=400727 RepID=A0A2T7PF13_POMCA|nr:hypothetical protein C0Q70_07435 [Pomacea canaliculata]
MLVSLREDLPGRGNILSRDPTDSEKQVSKTTGVDVGVVPCNLKLLPPPSLASWTGFYDTDSWMCCE